MNKRIKDLGFSVLERLADMKTTVPALFIGAISVYALINDKATLVEVGAFLGVAVGLLFAKIKKK